MTSVVTAGGISVTIRGAVVDEGETVLERLVSDGVPGSLTSRNSKLWGPDAAPLAARRLGWLDLPETSRSLRDRLAGPAGAARDAGLDRIVLAASGGTAPAAEAMCRTAGAELIVLDTTDPHEVAGVLAGELARTLVVVVGGSVEAESLRRVFGHAFCEAGLSGAGLARRFVVVAEEGSGLARAAREAGHHLVPAEPDVDGRFGEPDARTAREGTAALPRAEKGTAPAMVRCSPELAEGAVEVHTPQGALRGARTLTEVLEAILADVPDGGYLAVLAYLDRSGDAAASGLRPLLATRGGELRRHPAPVTFGWGPRYLHTTGQYHRGGPPNGAFLMITGAVTADVPVPGRPYSLGELQLAQALGDLRALRSLGRPAVRLHLRDRAEGLAQLAAALG